MDIVLILLLLSICALAYYRLTSGDDVQPSVMRAAKTLGVPVSAYLALWLATTFLAPTVSRNLQFVVMQINNLDTSSSNLLYTSTEAVNLVSFAADFSAWQCFLMPLLWFGTISFAMFGGVGLGYLPMDLFRAWKHQPKKPELLEHVLARRVVLEHNRALISQAEQLRVVQREIKLDVFPDAESKAAATKRYLRLLKETKQDFALFESVYESWMQNDHIDRVNPFLYDACLVMAALLGFVSLLFMAHIALGLLKEFTLLESVFFALSSQNVAAAAMAFIALSCYMVIASVYGVQKMTMIWSSLFDGHPMKLHRTWLETLTFNFALCLLNTIGFTALITRYLPSYLRSLDITKIFSKMLSHLKPMYEPVKFKAFGYCLILFFLFGVFLQLYYVSPRELMETKVWEEKDKIEKRREVLEVLEKMPLPLNIDEL